MKMEGNTMSLFTFKRGIHPPDEKKGTASRPIKIILPKDGAEMVYPLVQHMGAPCESLVKKGQRVLLGEKIADSKNNFSSPIHTSVSGVVKEIRPSLSPNGNTYDAIVIENDGKLTEHPSIAPKKNYKEYSKEELLAIIREAGIVGLGGAGFPTHIKLNAPKEKKIDFIIINGAECEPFLTTDYRVMLEESERIMLGLKVMLHIHPTAKIVIAIENNKPDAIEAMKQVCVGEKKIEVVTLQTKYPQGSEKQLIFSCTGREVPSGGLPADVGCIVHNVDTVTAIHGALFRGRPLMRKIVTITGGGVKNPGNYKVRLGMSVQDVIEAIGGLTDDVEKIICGGPMMGVAVYSLDMPVIKTTSGILCLTKEEAYIPLEKNCIRCGKCVKSCPMGLLPLQLNSHVIHGKIDDFEKDNGLDCIECGSCSYVCPAKRHLAQSIRATKKTLLTSKKK